MYDSECWLPASMIEIYPIKDVRGHVSEELIFEGFKSPKWIP